jgi:hypothetical protein
MSKKIKVFIDKLSTVNHFNDALWLNIIPLDTGRVQSKGDKMRNNNQ